MNGLDYKDFARCRTCPHRGGSDGCDEYGGPGVDALTAVNQCIEDNPHKHLELAIIDRGAFAAYVDQTHLLRTTDGRDLPPEHLKGFVAGALAYRAYLREKGDVR
jgi:hypothetical protein